MTMGMIMEMNMRMSTPAMTMTLISSFIRSFDVDNYNL